MKVLCVRNDRVLQAGASHTLKGQTRLRPEGCAEVVTKVRPGDR